MDDFLNNNDNNYTEPENVNEPAADEGADSADNTAVPTKNIESADGKTENTEGGAPLGNNTAGFGEPSVMNQINYSPVEPVKDYKPVSRGLKVFAAVMAAVIMLTGASAAGYFLGRSSTGTLRRSKVNVSLTAKPKDTDEMTAAQVYEKVDGSVVGITVYNTAGNGAQASGVVYSKDGYIVTNDHIYSEVPAAKFKVYTADGKEYDAKYVAGDKVSDLAVLKIDGANLTPAEFGDSDEIINGENVVAIGRPNDATSESSITKGIISSVARRVRTTTNYSAKLIQTDSAINPGSSGGALVNMYGQVVGITSSKLAGTEYDTVGFAIPTKTMKRICSELISEGKVVSRAKLGITYTAINSVTAEINGYDCVGLYVASVSEDSDLYGKISEGDVITHINGIEAVNDSVVLDIIEDSSAGDKITVTVKTKSGGTKEFEAVLKANTSESSYTNEIKSQDSSGSNRDNSGNSSGGGTFDFPGGE